MSPEQKNLGDLLSGKKRNTSHISLGSMLPRADDLFDFNDRPRIPEPDPNITSPEVLNNNFSVVLAPKDEWAKALSQICENPLKYKAIPQEVGATVKLNDYTGLVMQITPPWSFYYEGRLIEHSMKLALELKDVNGKKPSNERQEDMNRFYLLKWLPEQVAHHLSTREENSWQIVGSTSDEVLISSSNSLRIRLTHEPERIDCHIDDIDLKKLDSFVEDVEDFLTVVANYSSTTFSPEKKVNKKVNIAPPKVKEEKQEARSVDGNTTNLLDFMRPKFDPEKYRLGVTGFELDDMIGNPEVKKQITDLLLMFENQDHFAKYGAKIPKGAIFHGPPGTGKTLAAKIIASQLGVPFYNYKISDIESMWVGETPKIVNGMYDNAKTPCVIFIDELDSVARDRKMGGTVGNEIVTMLLQKIDGIDSKPGVILLGATNDIEAIDPAIRRGGRLREIKVDLPDSDTRAQTFVYYLEKAIQVAQNNGISLFPDMDENSIQSFANLTEGLAQSDIEVIVNDAIFEQAKRALTNPEDLLTGDEVELMIRSYVNQKQGKTKPNRKIGFNASL